jgi:hypothetical protein
MMIECDECKVQISSSAAACPHCGKVSLARKVNKTLGNVLGMLFWLFLMFAVILIARRGSTRFFRSCVLSAEAK